MAQYSDEFGALVRQALVGVSDREVARRSRGAVSHYTIGQMRAGLVPYAELIIAFARALDRDPNPFLDAAGKHDIRAVPVGKGRDAASVRRRVAAGSRPVAVAL